jgi:4-hydroxy-tetrahydrodipicolinate synthase
VPGLANLAPEWCVGVYEAFRRGDLSAAMNYQAKLSPIRLALALGTAPGTIKAVMNLMGRSVGPSRSPLAPLPPEKQQKLRAILEQVGLLGR